MDLGEITHLPTPIKPHVNFSSFVFNILLLDFSLPRWSVNLAFSTSFFTVLLKAGDRRPHFPQRLFYNISCYLSTKSFNLRYLHQRQILSWNAFLHCVPNYLLPLLTALWLLHQRPLEWSECSILMGTPCHRGGGGAWLKMSTSPNSFPLWLYWRVWWPSTGEHSMSWLGT